MDNKEKIIVRNSTINFSTLLTLIFVIAKLMGVIQWSWWIVFLPMLFNLGLVIIIISIAIVVAVYMGYKDK